MMALGTFRANAETECMREQIIHSHHRQQTLQGTGPQDGTFQDVKLSQRVAAQGHVPWVVQRKKSHARLVPQLQA
jgi:hypothetical protein